MKNLRTILFTLLLIGCNLITNTVFAQDEEDPGFPGEDPGAPIDNWVVPMVTIAVCFMFIICRKQLNLKQK